MDFSNYKFRASSVGYLMTEPKSKADKEAGNLSETAKAHCIDCFVSAMYGRQTEIQTKYTKKGNQVEEDSITLYSRIKKTFFKKNIERLENEFICGTPDLFTGLSIKEADTIRDIKSSWDLYTFHRTNAKELNSNYYWQLQSYDWLSGAHSSFLAYCLVNTPVALIEEEKRRLFYKMNVATIENPLYKEACEELELSMIYDDIPTYQRLNEIEVLRNNDDIERIPYKVIKAREFMQQYHDKICKPSVMMAEYDTEAKAIIIQ